MVPCYSNSSLIRHRPTVAALLVCRDAACGKTHTILHICIVAIYSLSYIILAKGWVKLWKDPSPSKCKTYIHIYAQCEMQVSDNDNDVTVVSMC